MIHDGHRQRIRKKFMNRDTMEDHEILEMVLFAAIPRCNTNEIAHHLIERFGSFRGVFEADATSLQTVEGIGPTAAFQIRLIAECIARYFIQGQDPRALLDNRTALEEYLRARFIGCNYEKTVLLLFNASGRLLEVHDIWEGSVSETMLPTREIITYATRDNAASAILAHNHPDGIPYPSDKDLAATLAIGKALASVDVTLIDHFIVAGNQCRPILYYRDNPESSEDRK